MRSDEPAGNADDVRYQQELWEKVFSRQNLMVALKRVERNRHHATPLLALSRTIGGTQPHDWMALKASNTHLVSSALGGDQ